MSNLRQLCISSLVLVVLLLGCSREDTTSSLDVPWFKNEQTLRNVDFQHVSGAAGEYLLPEIMGSGVAVFDSDKDGDLDLYFIQSGSFDSPDKSVVNQLYINVGEGNFAHSNNSGLESAAYGMGVAVGDYDQDGLVDVFVTNVGSNELFRNLGENQFINITDEAGVGESGFGTACLFADLDRDGDLDLFVTNYVDWQRATEKDCYDSGTGARNYCDPGNYDNPTADLLYRNNGDGSFTDISVDSGIASEKGNGLGAVASDFNNDGLLDIYVANDKTPNHLWINHGDLTFKNEALERAAAMDSQGIAKAGMGVVSIDIDEDSDLDLIVVNIETETDSVYRNEGSYFADATAQIGLTRKSRNFTRFGVVVADFNRDGYLDMYQANGKVTYSPESETDDPFAERNLLFTGRSGPFFAPLTIEETRTPIGIHTSRALAVGDLNGDHALDLIVTNRDEKPYLLINQHPPSPSVRTIRLETPNGSPDLHARLYAVSGTDLILLGEVQVAGSYLAALSSKIVVTQERLQEPFTYKVTWSDGSEEIFTPTDVHETLTLVQGSGHPI